MTEVFGIENLEAEIAKEFTEQAKAINFSNCQIPYQEYPVSQGKV